MRLLKKCQLGAALVLLAAGLFVVGADALFIGKYGVDYNSAAFVVGSRDFADWPTGERPLYSYVPAAGYGMAAWLVALLLFTLSPTIREYRGRVRRGTE
jgi:hypothetical protein